MISTTRTPCYDAAMDIVVMPGACGDYVVWADDDKSRCTAPVKLARFDQFDTAYLLLYAFANGPGSRELLAQAPEVMGSFTAHCGEAC